ncbi:MAG: phosphodiester glycosidase family protein [Bacteroidetes bacterium]|nr:phosphodiester glycosidase family protein [Bacteroidota bacterium]MCZ2132343.1 phosphodiester glycosidase family protein [Bacteroidota bacterium]
MIRFHNLIFILLVPVATVAVICSLQSVSAKNKALRKKAVAYSVAKKNKPIALSGKSRKSLRKRGAPPITRVQIVSDTMLAEGTRLINFIFGRQRHNVFALELDVDSPNAELEVVKSLDAAGGLERVIDITRRFDSCCNRTVVAAVNANFWRAYRNLAIGPLVVDGEVVQMLNYKQWSSAFFDEKGRMTIDRYSMSGTLRSANGSLPVVSVNYRRDSLGVCVYNRFSGREIPSISQKSVEQAFEELRLNSLMLGDDSTEITLDIEQMKNDIARAKLEADAEYGLVKAQVRYLEKPIVNRPARCVVDSVAPGAVTIPANGCVLSFGIDCALQNIPRVGDTLALQFTTIPNSGQPYKWAVSGTPRLMRNGAAKHEAAIEGVTSKRFIRNNLARTAIGTNKNRSKNILVVVQANNEQGKGADLAQMASIMKQAGAWNALNLDGGGSTRMIATGRNVFNGDTASTGRRVAAMLAVILKNKSAAHAEKGKIPENSGGKQ